MAWSYSGDPASKSRDAVRFLIEDTDTNRQLLQDAEIDWLLTQEANIYMAAARAAEIIAGKPGNVTEKWVGDLRITYGAEHWKDLAEKLRARGRTYQKPSAGGISIASKDILEENSDWPKPDFARGLHDNPQTVDPLKEKC